VIAADRISTPAGADAGLRGGKADIVGLARMSRVDPQRPQKARSGDDRKILLCGPKCDTCMQLVMRGKPEFYPRWPKEKRAA
jgi:2,4-dienoyl-CoA reductase (NADPH2)